MSIMWNLPNNKIILGLIFIALLAGELVRIPVLNQIKVNISDIVVVAITCFWLVKQVKSRSRQINSYTMLILVIFFTMIFTLIMRAGEVPIQLLIGASLYPVRWALYFQLYVIIKEALIEPSNLNFATNAVKTIIPALAVLAIIQLFVFPNLKFIESYGFDPHFFRAVSTWLDPNYFGFAMVFGIIFILGTKYKKVWIKWVSFLLTFASLITTFSRSSYLILAIAFIAFALLKRSVKIISIGLIIIVISLVIFIFPRQSLEKGRNIDRNMSADLRLGSYAQAVDLFQGRPLTGVGYNLIRYEKNNRGWVLDLHEGGNSGAGFDSSYLVIIASMGVLGASVFALFIFKLLDIASGGVLSNKNSIVSMLKTRFNNQIAILTSITIAWLVGSWFINAFFYSLLILFWVTLAAVLRNDPKDYK
jgi:O-antigen ligase